jgi:trans-aconitate methyltransferase
MTENDRQTNEEAHARIIRGDRAATDWNATTYHRVSKPQFAWGLRSLDRLVLEGHEHAADVGCGTGRLTRELAGRLPRGSVIGVDRSASMLAQARQHLEAGSHVPLVRASADALPFADVFDVVFSNATFHWVLDHDALFASLFAALRAGGRLHAQCGGAGNLGRLRARAATLIREPPFDRFFAGWRECWLYADPDTTAARLARAGFAEIETRLEPSPATLPGRPEYREFVETVCLRPYLERLPPDAQARFTDELVDQAAGDEPAFTLDYCRLAIAARKP